jgi:hypothetical protein
MACPEFWLDYLHPLSGADEVSEENILNTKQYIVKDQPDNQKSNAPDIDQFIVLNSLSTISAASITPSKSLKLFMYTTMYYNYIQKVHTSHKKPENTEKN